MYSRLELIDACLSLNGEERSSKRGSRQLVAQEAELLGQVNTCEARDDLQDWLVALKAVIREEML